MKTREQLLRQIDAYKAATGRSDRWISAQATKNPKLILRVRRGENVTLKQLEKIENLIFAEAA